MWEKFKDIQHKIWFTWGAERQVEVPISFTAVHPTNGIHDFRVHYYVLSSYAINKGHFVLHPPNIID